MKTLPLLLITTLPFISINAAAEAQPFDMDFGISHKSYSIDMPSRSSKNINDKASRIFAFGLSLEEEFNEYFTLHIEAAKGYTTGDTGYQFIQDGKLVTETFDTQLDYSLSVIGQILPFGRKTISPVILLGATSTSISYDYKRTENSIIKEDKDKTTTSSAIQYGAGLEAHPTDDLKLSLTYMDLSNLKYKTHSVNFEIVIKL